MKNKKGFKLFNFIMKIVSWCVMAILCVIASFLIIYIIVNKIAQSKGQNAPLGLYTIISPSMTPDIEVYDVVVVIRKDPSKIEVGDIISYYSTNTGVFGDTPITHRVVEKFNTNNGYSFRTKGDANPVVDNEVIMEDHVIGTVRFLIPGLGRIQFFLASKGGWFIAILVPAVGIIIYDIVKLYKLIKVRNKINYAEKITYSERKSKNTRTNSNIKDYPFNKDFKEENYKRNKNDYIPKHNRNKRR